MLNKLMGILFFSKITKTSPTASLDGHGTQDPFPLLLMRLKVINASTLDLSYQEAKDLLEQIVIGSAYFVIYKQHFYKQQAGIFWSHVFYSLC